MPKEKRLRTVADMREAFGVPRGVPRLPPMKEGAIVGFNPSGLLDGRGFVVRFRGGAIVPDAESVTNAEYARLRDAQK